MFKRLSFSSRALLLTLTLFVGWWVLPLVVKRMMGVSFFEFQAPSRVAVSFLRDLSDYWSMRGHSKDELIRAGMEQARLNAAYAIANQQAEFRQREIERLQTLLNLPSLTEYRYEVARVVSRDLNNWWHRIVVRKGRLHGIEPGMGVIYAGGVVGRVVEVQTFTCVIELLSNPSFRVAGHVDGDERPMQFQGGLNPGLGAPLAMVSNVPADLRATPENPLRIVSSRLGGVFPDGLTLGYVSRLEPGRDGLFQSGYARIDQRLTGLREVAILVPIEPELNTFDTKAVPTGAPATAEPPRPRAR